MNNITINKAVPIVSVSTPKLYTLVVSNKYQSVSITVNKPAISVSGSLLNGLPEAPIDGKQYARKDASWSEVGATSGTVTSVTAGNGLTQTGTFTIDPTIDVVSAVGTSGSVGTLVITAEAVGVSLGNTGTTACAGDDLRLFNARAPTTHNQTASTITDFAAATLAAAPAETASTIGALINGSGAITPADTDLVALTSTSVLKNITWANFKTALSSVFAALAGSPTQAFSTAALGITGDVAINGTGHRITGDFSNATVANRVLVQTSAATSNSFIGVVTNGGPNAGFNAYNKSDPTNSNSIDFRVTATEVRLSSAISGTTSTYLPITFFNGGLQRASIISNGNVLLGSTAVDGVGAEKLQVTGAIAATTTIKTGGYTVATLPAGTIGVRTYVTDALAPTFGAAPVAGGTVVIPVFHNGTNWIVG